MKLLNVLMLFIFIQFILTADDIDDSSSDENNCVSKIEENISSDTCGEKKVEEGMSCCLLSFVDGAKRLKMCLQIEDDEIVKERYLNSLESNKILGSILADDATIECFSNIPVDKPLSPVVYFDVPKESMEITLDYIMKL